MKKIVPHPSAIKRQTGRGGSYANSGGSGAPTYVPRSRQGISLPCDGLNLSEGITPKVYAEHVEGAEWPMAPAA